MKTLLVPVDFSDAMPAVLNEAKRLAKATSCGLHLLHVLEPMVSYVPVGASMDVLAAPSPVADDEVLHTAKKRLESMAEGVKACGVEVRAEALSGLAVDEILERAGSPEVEMVVMGSHGHGALYHLFNGSVVNGVLRRARCPVVVVPSGAWKWAESARS